MKNKFSVCISVLFFSLSFVSCEYNMAELFFRKNAVYTRTAEVKPVDAPAGTKDVSKFSVLIFSDIHYGNTRMLDFREDDLVSKIKEKASELSSAFPLKFSLCLGDVADHGFENEFADYEKFVGRLRNECSLVTYTIPGNHDLYFGGWTHYVNYCYPNYGSFKFVTECGSNKISWYFLDSANGTLGPKQFESLKNNLASDGNMKFVFTHYPLYAGGVYYFCMQDLDERNELIKMFADSKSRYLFDGHNHPGGRYDFTPTFHEENLMSVREFHSFCILKVDAASGNHSVEVVSF